MKPGTPSPDKQVLLDPYVSTISKTPISPESTHVGTLFEFLDRRNGSLNSTQHSYFMQKMQKIDRNSEETQMNKTTYANRDPRDELLDKLLTGKHSLPKLLGKQNIPQSGVSFSLPISKIRHRRQRTNVIEDTSGISQMNKLHVTLDHKGPKAPNPEEEDVRKFKKKHHILRTIVKQHQIMNKTSSGEINSNIEETFKRLHNGYEGIREEASRGKSRGHVTGDLSKDVQQVLSNNKNDELILKHLERNLERRRPHANQNEANRVLWSKDLTHWRRTRGKEDNGVRSPSRIEELMADLSKDLRTHGLIRRVMEDFKDPEPRSKSKKRVTMVNFMK